MRRDGVRTDLWIRKTVSELVTCEDCEGKENWRWRSESYLFVINDSTVECSTLRYVTIYEMRMWLFQQGKERKRNEVSYKVIDIKVAGPSIYPSTLSVPRVLSERGIVCRIVLLTHTNFKHLFWFALPCHTLLQHIAPHRMNTHSQLENHVCLTFNSTGHDQSDFINSTVPFRSIPVTYGLFRCYSIVLPLWGMYILSFLLFSWIVFRFYD